MFIFETISKAAKLYSLLGFSQSVRFCGHYLLGTKQPIPLRIAGIDTLLYCRVRDSDIQVLNQIFGKKWFSHDSIVSPQLIVDGGAYVGYSSIFFASQYPDAKIIAIEPSDENCELFRQNCAGYDNIQLVQAAVWDTDCGLSIENPDDHSWMLRVTEPEQRDAVDIYGVNLDSILQDSGFTKIGLLKLDIEGAERVVFGRNYERWLNRTEHMLIELHERYQPGCEATFMGAMESQACSTSQHGEYTYVQRPADWEPALS